VIKSCPPLLYTVVAFLLQNLTSDFWQNYDCLFLTKKYLAASVIDIAEAEPAAASSSLYHSLYRLQKTHGIVDVVVVVVVVILIVVGVVGVFVVVDVVVVVILIFVGVVGVVDLVGDFGVVAVVVVVVADVFDFVITIIIAVDADVPIADVVAVVEIRDIFSGRTIAIVLQII